MNTYISDEEEEDEFDIVRVIGVILPLLLFREPIPEHNSIFTGQMRYHELIESDHDGRFRNAARMDKQTFVNLISFLKDAAGLEDSRNLCAGEKVMIFIAVLNAFSVRHVSEIWQHSYSTISCTIHETSDCLKRVRNQLIVRAVAALAPRVRSSPKFFPFFQHCIGALDGSQIPAIVSPAEQAVFRNRKQYLSQNILAVVNFDHVFTYVLAGWEGSAHDGRVLGDALHKGFTIIPGKYYLGDAGYSLTSYCLTPYRGVRYHLKEWVRGQQRPQNRMELFNLRHSMLRNIIERSLGIVKRRFPLLENMHSFPFRFQVDLVLCCFMLHNFIRLNQDYIDPYFDYYDLGDDDQNGYGADDGEEPEVINDAALVGWRDGIAEEMWLAYQVELQRRGLLP